LRISIGAAQDFFSFNAFCTFDEPKSGVIEYNVIS